MSLLDEAKELFGDMRNLTQEEQDEMENTIKEMSKPTGITLFDFDTKPRKSIEVGDTVINLGDIESIIESPWGELTIKASKYEVVENNNDKNYLYYHVRDLETGEGYYILKQNIIKVNGWKDDLGEV